MLILKLVKLKELVGWKTKIIKAVKHSGFLGSQRWSGVIQKVVCDELYLGY